MEPAPSTWLNMSDVQSERTRVSSIIAPDSPSRSHLSISSCWFDHDLFEDSTETLAPIAFNPSIDRPLSLHAKNIASTWTYDPKFEVDWKENDPMNPVNWPTWYKGLTIASIAWGTFVVVTYSTSYTTGLTGMMDDFDVDSRPVVALGVTSYR